VYTSHEHQSPGRVMTRGASRQAVASADNTPASTHADNTAASSDALGIPDVETVKIFGEEAEAKVKADTVGGNSQNGNLATPVDAGLMNWGDMWNRMSEQGWGWIDGDGLVDWYYVHPTFAGRSKSEIMKKGKEGNDYCLKESAMR